MKNPRNLFGLALAGLMIWIAGPLCSQSRLASSAFANETNSNQARQLSPAFAAPVSLHTTEPGQPTKTRVSEAYGKLPLSFEANHGQTDPKVKFISRGRGYNLFLTSTEAMLILSKSTALKKRQASPAARQAVEARPAKIQRAVLRMKLVGANYFLFGRFSWPQR